MTMMGKSIRQIWVNQLTGTETPVLGDLDLSPSDLQLTEDDIEDLVKECSKGKCKFCIKKGFTGKMFFKAFA